MTVVISTQAIVTATTTSTSTVQKGKTTLPIVTITARKRTLYSFTDEVFLINHSYPYPHQDQVHADHEHRDHFDQNPDCYRYDHVDQHGVGISLHDQGWQHGVKWTLVSQSLLVFLLVVISLVFLVNGPRDGRVQMSASKQTDTRLDRRQTPHVYISKQQATGSKQAFAKQPFAITISIFLQVTRVK